MRVLNLVEVTAYLKELVEFDPILSDIWVRGEVTNFSTSAAGHSYFSLSGDGVQLSCVLFRGNKARLLARPENGDAVLAHGRFSIYETRGQYQLIVDNVAPEGMGILQLQYEDTRRRLEDEGLFAIDRKRALPEMPRTIGVVTSEHGAVWHDIQHVIARRFPLARLVLSPSSVQGPGASSELTAALEVLQSVAQPDVIIMGRGGGSMEDLAAFSDEGLARAIFKARVPIVSAVGHETDTCIADLVADVRAPTPSAAAELCVPDRRMLLSTVDQCAVDAKSRIDKALATSRAHMRLVQTALTYSSPKPRITRYQQDTDDLLARTVAVTRRKISAASAHVDEMHRRATLLNPSEILRRGYAVVTTLVHGNEKRLTSASEARQHDTVTITMRDGSVDARTVQETP